MNSPVNVPWTTSTTQGSEAYYKKTDSLQSPNLGNPLLWGNNQVANNWPQVSNYQLPPQQSSSWSSNSNNGSRVYNSSTLGYSNNNFNTGVESNRSYNNSTIENIPNNSFISNGNLLDPGENSDMASRDRTQEFIRIIRSQQGSHSNGTIPQRNKGRTQDIRHYAEFMQRSK